MTDRHAPQAPLAGQAPGSGPDLNGESMNNADLKAMTEEVLHAHVRAALGTASGRVLREFLRRQCFMAPARSTPGWNSKEQVEFRYGRMTLFQALEFYEDPRNFQTKE